MAITIFTAPRSPALSQDDNYVVLETDIPTASARPGFLVSGIGANTNVLRLRWGTTLVEMTFVANPTSPLELRAALNQTAEEFYPQLMEGLFSVPAIESAFIITLTATGVLLTLRGIPNGALLAGSSGVTVTVFGVGATARPNLSAMVSVYQVGRVAPLVRLEGTYNPAGFTEINFANLLPVQVGLPNASLMAGGNYGVETPGGFAEFFFRYADQYGSPPQPERLTKSANFAVVAGGSAGGSRRRWGASGNIQLCHAYFNSQDQFFSKPIGRQQPDWVYLYVNSATATTVFVTVTFSDGTMAERQVSASVALAKGLHAFPSGPLQTAIASVTGADTKLAVRYTFELRSLGPSVTYDLLPDFHPWQVVLAYDNGAGGIETVAMRGIAERGYRVEASTFRRAQTRVQGSDEGSIVTYDAEGAFSHRLRSGYYPADYIEHLRALMLGRVWLVDTLARRFVAVQIDGRSLSLTTDDDDLHALEFTITSATPDRGAHNF